MTRTRYMRKGELVVRIGEIQNELYFMETGIARGYFLDIDGKEVTDCLYFQRGTSVVSFGQLECNDPSPLTIEILEDGNFFCVPTTDIVRLKNQYPEAMELYNRMLVAALDVQWKLKRVLSSCTAVQRYQWFLEEYPGLINRVSNRHVASFLGMTPVTLSRLRRSLREE